MYRNSIYYIVFTTIIFIPLSSFACDLCAVYSSIESSRGAKDSVNVGSAYQFTHYESNIRPDGHNSLPGQHLESHINQFFIDYNLLDEFSLQLNVPLIYRDYRRIDNTGQIDTGSESGLGDLTLLGKYEAYRKHSDEYAHHIEILGGIKLPTGSSSRLKEEASELHTRHGSVSGSLVGGDLLTLGTGSVDFLLGVNTFNQYGKWFLTTFLQYNFREEGDYDYQFGDDLYWQISPGYFLSLEHENTIAARIRLSGESKGRDSINSRDLAGTSDTRIYLGPQLQFTFADQWFLQFGADAAIKKESSEEQVTPRYRVLGVLSKKF